MIETLEVYDGRPLIGEGRIKKLLQKAGYPATGENVERAHATVHAALAKAFLDATESDVPWAEPTFGVPTPLPIIEFSPSSWSAPSTMQLPDQVEMGEALEPLNLLPPHDLQRIGEPTDRYIDGPLSTVLDAVKKHKRNKKKWSKGVEDDARRAWAILIAAVGDIHFSALRQAHLTLLDDLFPVLDPKYRYLAHIGIMVFVERSIMGSP